MDMTARVVKQYDAIAKEYAKKIARRESKIQIDLFKHYVRKGSKVLDAGCAAGRDTKKLAQNGYSVTGIDLSKNLLALAKHENPKLTFIEADIRSLPFEKASFDAVWAIAVIHHLEKGDISKALGEFYRVLKTNGFLFITTKKGQGAKAITEALSQNRKREFTFLIRNELSEMLQKADFKEVELHETESEQREVSWIQAIYQK